MAKVHNKTNKTNKTNKANKTNKEIWLVSYKLNTIPSYRTYQKELLASMTKF
jgi:hypothetical protein